MNIANINAKSSHKVQNSASKSSGNALASYKKGQVIEGIISKVSDKISINFSGKEMKFPSQAVRNAKEGEIRKFEITDISDSSIVLKEVGDSTNSSDTGNAVCTTVETNQITFTDHLEKSAEEKAAEDAKAKENEEAKNSLDDTANRMTEDDYSALEEEGDLAAYELDRLELALERVKSQRTTRQEDVVKQVEKKEDYQKLIDNMVHNTGIDGALAEKIVQKLLDAGLPVTEDNIEQIASAMSQTTQIKDMSDKAMNYLIDQNLEPTIENIYKAEYSGSPKDSQPVDEDAWNDLLRRITEIIMDADLQVNEENIGNAKWLLGEGLPITKENLILLNSLKEIKQMAGSENSEEYFLNKIVSALSEGTNAKQASLDSYEENKVVQIIENLATIEDEAVDLVIQQEKEVNIKNLTEAQKTVESEKQKQSNSRPENGKTNTLWENTAAEYISELDNIDIATITVRRQLEEIRLKMTIDAGKTLQGKGIDLNTTQLINIIDELKALEDDYYKNVMKELKVDENADHLDLLRETTTKVTELKAMPNYIIGSRLTGTSSDTLDSLHSRGAVLQSEFYRAGTAYETLMTTPSSEYGDSIKKAFRSVDPMLEDMNLELTDANRRAVRILGYNGIEINEENILSMKNYDAKVNNLLDNLHPAVTVQLIKDGINPLDTPIDELNQQVMDIKENLGVTEEEKYSKYLWKLEQQGGVTEDERKSYIGIYRLLNNVEKTDGAALGAVIQADQELTLNNLLTAVRTIKSNGVDASVDDRFGALERLSFSRESITDQIQAGYSATTEQGRSQQSSQAMTADSNHDKMEYYTQVVSDILDDISPYKINELAKEGNLFEESIELLKEKISAEADDPNIDGQYYKNKLNQLREVADHSESAIELLNRYDVPVTVDHLMSAKLLESQSNHLYKEMNRQLKITDEDKGSKSEVKQVIDGFEDALTSSEAMNEQYEKLEKAVSGLLDEEYGNNQITSKHLTALKNINNGIELVKSLSRSEHYEIPVAIGDQITNIKLTIVHGTKDKGNVQMSVNSEQLGNINADFSVKNGEVKGFILCEQRAGLDAMKNGAEDLESKIEQAGLTLNQLNYGVGNISSHSYTGQRGNQAEEMNDNVNTEQLYRIAKAFVHQVKTMERI